jgi:hypothetical protein
MSKFWQKFIFWENLKKTCALFGGPVTAGLHQFEAANVYVWLSGCLAMLGAALTIWATDNNKNGIVDLFDNENNNNPA